MKFVKITQTNGVRTIALNRPEKRNAFHAEMILELTEAFNEANVDPDVRAILLTGEGETFCAGGDLEWMRSMADFSHNENLADAEKLFQLYATIYAAPMPVVGRVFGHAFGGGAGLLSVCDLVAAESQTQISFSEVKWGLVPAVISPFVRARANVASVYEWFLTAKIFDAAEALRGQLISFSGTMAEVDAYVESSLKKIRAAAPEATRDTKALLRSYEQQDWTSVKAHVTELIARRRTSAEGQAGLRAFLEKRQPPWNEVSPNARKKV